MHNSRVTMKNRIFFTTDSEKTKRAAFEAIKAEQETIGYYALPEQNIEPIISYAETIPKTVETIAVIGIGGSSLGAKAVYEFVKPVKKLQRKLYFFESTDPINITTLLSEIDLENTHFLVISKSGTTIETFSIYKYIYSLHSDPNAYTFITDHHRSRFSVRAVCPEHRCVCSASTGKCRWTLFGSFYSRTHSACSLWYRCKGSS